MGRALSKLKRLVLRPRDPFVSAEINPLVGYRCCPGEIDVLEPVTESADVSLSSGVIQPPGLVDVAGVVFDLRRDGVYRFYRLPTLSEQRIVCTQGVESILQSIGYLFGYGDDDNNVSVTDSIKELSHRRLVAGCGPLAFFTQQILSFFQIRSRVVGLMTLKPWGGQDDGHTLLEIADHGNNWFLYDPSFGVCFKKDGQRLSLVEFVKLKNENLELENFPSNLGYSRSANTRYDYDFWLAQRFLSSGCLWDWYRRIGQLPIIYHNGKFCCCESSIKNNGERKRISNRYTILPDNQFHKEFYL